MQLPRSLPHKIQDKGTLVLTKRWGSSEEIWERAAANPQMCHPHNTGKMLGIRWFWPCKCVPWQQWPQRVWQDGVFILPAKSLPFQVAFNVTDLFLCPSKSEGPLWLHSSNCLSSLLLIVLGPNYSPYASGWMCTQEAHSEKVPAISLPVPHLHCISWHCLQHLFPITIKYWSLQWQHIL